MLILNPAMHDWIYLVAQDSLLDQPGIAVQSHPGVTAAPHPDRSLRTKHHKLCLTKYTALNVGYHIKDKCNDNK